MNYIILLIIIILEILIIWQKNKELSILDQTIEDNDSLIDSQRGLIETYEQLLVKKNDKISRIEQLYNISENERIRLCKENAKLKEQKEII